MIPVRVQADLKVVLASDRRFEISDPHPLHDAPCPVCDGPLSHGPSVLVFVGIAPDDRKDAGWTTGAAVAVHEACAVPA
jgi:hypothetical protein